MPRILTYPQRLVQPVLLCPNNTYSSTFTAVKKTSVGMISVFGSVQAGSGALVLMAGGIVGNSLLHAQGGEYCESECGHGVGGGAGWWCWR
jgi:hypothetical protein